MALQPEPPDIGGGSVTSFPDPAAYQWIEVGSGFKQALFLTGAGDGSGRLFIVSQAGQIEILQNGQKLPEPFLDISDRTTRPGITGSLGERGLLGLAFHPRYAENGFFFVNYTDRNGNTHISRFNVSAQDPNRADRDSEVELLFIEQPFPNHNGGGLAFGPDGYLYIALGDGGSGGDPQGNGQSLNTLLGKILRIDVDSRQPYAIPPDNPFAGEGGLGEIWAYGLRNPWRIAFDRLTGDFYIADVGQNQYEEINFQAAGGPGGENYGWDFREASHPFEGTPPEGLALVEPIAEYSHELGCSVTGGDVYRGMNLPAWQGVYFYGDYCSGRVWGLLRDPTGRWENRLLFETGFTITSFGLDEEGEVYVIQYPQGKVFRLDQR
jgi:glucose/arabinose dehydrogenase